MSFIPNKIILWAVDDFNSLGVIRQLGNQGLDLLFLIKGNANIAAKSKYCTHYIETETLQDGYNYLLTNFSNEKIKPIILLSGDDTMTFVDQHRSSLSPLFLLPGSKTEGIVTKYTDKNNMASLAEKLGFLSPKSFYIKKDSLIDDIIYPCIIKPSHERPGHYNEFKYKICKDQLQLRYTLSLVNPESQFIVQQYIPKEKDILIYGLRLQSGEVILAGAFIKNRLSADASGSFGYITNKIPIYIDAELITKFLCHIDYYGLFSFEYGVVGDKAYFFEVNLRNDGTSHYFYQLGANLPLAYIYDASGQDIYNIQTKVTQCGWFIDELFDIENLLMGKLSYKQWKTDKEKATVYKYYDKDDMIPYQIIKKNQLKLLFVHLMLKYFRVQIIYILDKMGLKK